jgi:NADPH:quinone reductase-like Zn-dependent oxidoreductase
LAEKVEITRQFTERFWPQLRSGELQPIIDTTFHIEEAQAAHEYVAADKNIGRVILVVSGQ